MQPDEQLEHFRMLWLLGDWNALRDADANCQNHINELTLFKIAGLFQLGYIEEAKQLLFKIDFTEDQKHLAAKLLISGIYNTLGKAHACYFNYTQAEKLCKISLAGIDGKFENNTILNARTSEQFSQLGIPRLPDNPATAQFKPDIKSYLQNSNSYFSTEPSLHIALAEYFQLNEEYESAIVHWQATSSLLNSEMPQPHYDRLREAYKLNKGFPQGTVAQESLGGDVDKHRLLGEIHKRLQPEFYFEIGVQTGKSLALAKCEAIGIDPMPMLNLDLPESTTVIAASSDAFFKKQCDVLLSKSIDLCFIDGMHLFEYVLRDFINIEKYSKPYSLIVIDDIFPGHRDQAKRERCTKAWTGDVWKIKSTLEKYRPDLFILAIDAFPTGLLLISAMDPSNDILERQYTEIQNCFSRDMEVPNEIICRHGAISGKSEFISEIIDTLIESKNQNLPATTIKSLLLKQS